MARTRERATIIITIAQATVIALAGGIAAEEILEAGVLRAEETAVAVAVEEEGIVVVAVKGY